MKGNSIRAIFAVGLLILLLGTARAGAGNNDAKGSPVNSAAYGVSDILGFDGATKWRRQSLRRCVRA